MLKVRPHTKSGGGGGEQSTSGPIYEKCVCGGGGGGGGGASPLQVRYLCLAHRKYVIVNTILTEGGAQAPGAPLLDTPLLNMHKEYLYRAYTCNNTQRVSTSNQWPVQT